MTINSNWENVFAANPSDDWQTQWHLDGARAKASGTPTDLVFESGSVEDGDAGHAVLWTRETFNGDLRIEYDYTRLDANVDHTSVCLLYVHATGIGAAPFDADILAWSELRTVPSMHLYFNHMNLYHISYACTGGADFNYVRARRYPT